MKKLEVYLDTSVISYLYQEDAFERMQDTLALWEFIGTSNKIQGGNTLEKGLQRAVPFL